MKIITLLASASLLLASCNQGELDKSNHQKDSLMSVLKERESNLNERENTLNEFISSFNEVERNLDCVAVRQHLIYKSTENVKGDLKGSQKDRINANINAINELMESNRQTIADLQKKIKRSNRKNAKLEETIATLTNQLAQKDAELTSLNEKLAALNAQIVQLQTSLDTLTSQSNAKSETIAGQVAAMHTAYYIIGRSKDLKEQKIIDKKGGLLGIGKTSKLSQEFDNSKFTKIDYTQTTSIPVNCDKVRIITTHPKGTYKFETNGKDEDNVSNLVITNPEKFWSASKYLVIEGVPNK
jgi:DNA repair exonuclease SbcCD ATPase subunit